MMTALPVPLFRGAPEIGCGLNTLTTGQFATNGTMDLGSWAVNANTGEVHAGALGVFMDDITAYAVLAARQPDEWCVTSALSVTFHAPALSAPQQLKGYASLDHRSSGWGHSSGKVLSDEGELVATIDQHMRYFPGTEEFHDPSRAYPVESGWLTSLDDFLTLDSVGPELGEFTLKDHPGLSNPLGALHGGLGLCFSEMAAQSMVQASDTLPDEPFVTSSVHVSYVRPAVFDGDLRTTSRVIHASRSIILMDVVIYSSTGKVGSHATVTLYRAATVNPS